MALDGSMPEYFRQRARTARDKGANCADQKLREQFELVAKHWDLLAAEYEALKR